MVLSVSLLQQETQACGRVLLQGHTSKKADPIDRRTLRRRSRVLWGEPIPLSRRTDLVCCPSSSFISFLFLFPHILCFCWRWSREKKRHGLWCVISFFWCPFVHPCSCSLVAVVTHVAKTRKKNTSPPKRKEGREKKKKRGEEGWGRKIKKTLHHHSIQCAGLDKHARFGRCVCIAHSFPGSEDRNVQSITLWGKGKERRKKKEETSGKVIKGRGRVPTQVGMRENSRRAELFDPNRISPFGFPTNNHRSSTLIW